MRYRIIGEKSWHVGTVENISATGVLFRGEHVVRVNSLIEVTVNMSRSLAEGYSSKIVSQGKVVRVTQDVADPETGMMAASLGRLRILRD
jgi:hypothetical protein